LKCEGRKVLRDWILNNRYIIGEISIRRITACKNKEQWQKVEICVLKWKR
jgi:hypothetical protein